MYYYLLVCNLIYRKNLSPEPKMESVYRHGLFKIRILRSVYSLPRYIELFEFVTYKKSLCYWLE